MNKAYLMPHPPLLIPGIGNGSEIPDTRHAFMEIADEIKKIAPDTIVLISPHSVMYEDYIHIAPGKVASGDFGKFGAKQISMELEYDTELASLIGETAQGDNIYSGFLGAKDRFLDYGVMVPLYFIGNHIKTVVISISGLSLIEHYRFGMCIKKAAAILKRSIVVIASGDMSHKLKNDGPYGYVPEGPEHDAFVKECIEVTDFVRLLSIDPLLYSRAAECGLKSLIMLLGTLDGFKVQSTVLNYEGPFGVGYLTASFDTTETTESLMPSILEAKKAKIAQIRKNEDVYVKLARENIEAYILKGEKMPVSNDLPEDLLLKRAGIFVSIKKDGNLRGCIGTIIATQPNIALEILKNSISAAVNDTRFDPVTSDELEDLVYSVDVLSEPEPIESPKYLNVNEYGVIVRCGGKCGLLLPNLEGVDTIHQQISIALQKAGIGNDEAYKLERFRVIRHT